MHHTDLSKFDNRWYKPGGNFLKRFFWFYINAVIFKTSLIPVSKIKVSLLRIFGAQVGKGVVIKPCVNIKYPWNLIIGDYTWIGENVWIDNLDEVIIGKNVCISQGAFLLCGNHNYKKSTFDLIIGKIKIDDGAWIGANSVVCQNVRVYKEAFLTVGSVASTNLSEFGIYKGNPAVKIKSRNIVS